MAANWLDLLTVLGFGGTVGAILAFAAAGRSFAAKLRHLAETLETALRDPRKADLNSLRTELRDVEKDSRSLLRTIQGLLKR